MATNPNIINLSTSYKLDLDNTEGVYNRDDATVAVGATLPSSVERTDVYLNDQGRWVRDKVTEVNVFKTGPKVREESSIKESGRRVKEYSAILEPLDKQIIEFNQQIRTQQQLIISEQNSAIGAGCSHDDPAGHGKGTLYLNSVAVGVGSTVYGDKIILEQYSNKYEKTNPNPFGDATLEDLVISNVTEGGKNRNYNSPFRVYDYDYDVYISGPNYGKHIIVNKWAGTAESGPDVPACVACINAQQAATDEINRLRILRDAKLADINALKEARMDDQIENWAHEREEVGFDDNRANTQRIINVIESVDIEKPSVKYSGLILHYDAKNNSKFMAAGSDWTDMSDNKYHAVIHEGASSRVSFNESEKEFVWTGTANDAGQGLFIQTLKYESGPEDQISAMTIEAWVKATSGTISPARDRDERAIISFDRSAVWKFALGSAEVSNSEGKPCFAFTEETAIGTNDIIAFDSADLRDDSWHQIAVTFDSNPTGAGTSLTYGPGISTASSVVIYVDGVVVGVDTNTHMPIGSQEETETPRYGWIGSRSESTFMGEISSSGGAKLPWLGSMGNIKYYDHALTESEIRNNFEVLRSDYGI